MIKAKNGNVKIAGRPADACTELSAVTKGIVEALVDNGMERELAVEFDKLGEQFMKIGKDMKGVQEDE